MHIVEQLIRERAPKLMKHPAFPVLRGPLFRLLAYDAAVFLTDAIRGLSGHEAFALVANHLRARLDVGGLTNVPGNGAAFVVSNHPTGLADGLAVFQALRDRRPDLCFLANADALRVIPGAADLIIPVEWRREKRSRAKSRQTLVDIREAVRAGRLLVFFPSGRLARLGWRGLAERPWEPSAFSLAIKHGVPIVPLRMRARNSALYYGFSKTSTELRDITLFHELLNKKGRTFRLTFGEAIRPEELPSRAEEALAYVRARVAKL